LRGVVPALVHSRSWEGDNNLPHILSAAQDDTECQAKCVPNKSKGSSCSKPIGLGVFHGRNIIRQESKEEWPPKYRQSDSISASAAGTPDSKPLHQRLEVVRFSPRASAAPPMPLMRQWDAVRTLRMCFVRWKQDRTICFSDKSKCGRRTARCCRANYHCMFDHVPQFSDISGPGIILHDSMEFLSMRSIRLPIFFSYSLTNVQTNSGISSRRSRRGGGHDGKTARR